MSQPHPHSSHFSSPDNYVLAPSTFPWALSSDDKTCRAVKPVDNVTWSCHNKPSLCHQLSSPRGAADEQICSHSWHNLTSETRDKLRAGATESLFATTLREKLTVFFCLDLLEGWGGGYCSAALVVIREGGITRNKKNFKKIWKMTSYKLLIEGAGRIFALWWWEIETLRQTWVLWGHQMFDL